MPLQDHGCQQIQDVPENIGAAEAILSVFSGASVLVSQSGLV